MPLDAVKVQLAINSGLSAVCSTCTKYWEGQDKGLSRCAALDGCGSPLAGDVFHEYDGPLTVFDRWCFVCAVSADFGLEVSGKNRVVGVCKKHIELFKQLQPVGAIVRPILVRTRDGSVSLDKVIPKPGKTLAQAIFEVEQYYKGKGN